MEKLLVALHLLHLNHEIDDRVLGAPYEVKAASGPFEQAPDVGQGRKLQQAVREQTPFELKQNGVYKMRARPMRIVLPNVGKIGSHAERRHPP